MTKANVRFIITVQSTGAPHRCQNFAPTDRLNAHFRRWDRAAAPRPAKKKIVAPARPPRHSAANCTPGRGRRRR